MNDGFYGWLIVFHGVEGELEAVFKRIQAIEGEVVEVLLTQFDPDMFDRIELGCIRR